MKTNFIEELNWRGMLHDMIPGTKELLEKEPSLGYIGFDPTADSLGVGNLVQVMTLLHFQRAGHKPIVLLGGATGRIGDPSGKSEERKLLDTETIQYNLGKQREQLQKFLNFESGENKAEIIDNYDWFSGIGFLDFIRDVGKYITVSYMMAKDSVQRRLETGMSFTEFSYQLVQGYDFYYLWEKRGVKLQMGGSDQWGNIVTGTELIRRKGNGEAFALTTPLIKKADGTKFGKSESGNIWLDPDKTSPYQFYQFWLNSADEDVINYIKIFTTLPQAEIENLIATHQQAPHQRLLQKTLAKDITIRVHSVQEYENALLASEFLFGNGTIESIASLDDKSIAGIFQGIPEAELEVALFTTGITLVDLLAQAKIAESKGEARRLIAGGGVFVNKVKLIDPNQLINQQNLLNQKYLLVQKGKKNYHLIKAFS